MVINHNETIIIPLFELKNNEAIIELMKKRKLINQLAIKTGRDELAIKDKACYNPEDANFNPLQYLADLLIGFGIYAL